MDAARELTPEQLCSVCAERALVFETTDDLEPLSGTVGQERALEALEVGLGIRHEGYNVFVVGIGGVGKHTVSRSLIQTRAATEPRPDDWCYVHSFDEPHKPHALRLPAGEGVDFRRRMEKFVDELEALLPVVFTSDRYTSRQRSISEAMEKVQAQALEAIEMEAVKHGLGLRKTEKGLSFQPKNPDGEGFLDEEAFAALPDEQRATFKTALDRMEEQLHALVGGVPRWRKETRERLRSYQDETTRAEVTRVIEPLKKAYADHADITAWLESVAVDVVDHVELFLDEDEDDDDSPGGRYARHTADHSLTRYEVNVLVDHSATQGAPVVYEDNPVYSRLIGRIEHISEFGALVTNHTLIKPGAMHLASGGYLIVDALRILTTPFSWDALKRTLRSRLLQLDAPTQEASLMSTVSLGPEPIPVDVKVVLLGPPELYYRLCEGDPDFERHFKILAWFEGKIDRSPDHTMRFARLLATKVREKGLRPFQREAVARIIEEGARDVEDSDFLSANLSRLFNMMDEADFWAERRGSAIVERADVTRAIAAWERRNSAPRDEMHRAILRDSLKVATTGTAVASINGLAVFSLGHFEFGRPGRITATARMGKGDLVDIERESGFAGEVHSKGVLILSALLRTTFARDIPMSVTASVVFEQSYGSIDGDSASLAEYLVLLSAIGQVPLAQSIALTGSINQHGDVQPIGGVNAKIEGFFDVCRGRGLTGEQGVVIPESNVKNLMLREDVLDAVRAGVFRVWSVDRVEPALALMTGLPVGECDARGEFPKGSVHERVETRLRTFWERRREIGDPSLRDH